MRTPRSSTGTRRRRSRLARTSSTGSSRTPTSRSACSAPSSGRVPEPRSPRRRRAASGAAASPSSPATCSSRAATGSQETFASERAHGLLAPWVLHTGLGPDAASSGFMTQVIAVAIQEGGMPVPRGGGARLADALVRLIEDNGGDLPDGRRGRVRPRRGRRADGVRTTDGETVEAERAVIANVTPTQLYGPLLGDPHGPRSPQAGRRFRYGRSEMQIHFALSEPPRWTGDDRLAGTAIVHVTPGLDGVSRAVNEAERGLLPAEATIVCGQPLTIDPSRAPEGKGMLWIQLQELPWHREGRRRRRARHRGRDMDGGAPRALRRPHPGTARAAHPEPRVVDPSGGRRSPPPISRPRTRTCTTATRTPARWRSTRTSSGARSPGARATGRRSTGSGTSARAPGPAPASARAPGRSSRRSC